jgi:hypothetical protein
MLLGGLNFAMVPETNASSKLYVFRTSRQNATRAVQPAKKDQKNVQPKVIPNELIVRLKPGAKIEDIARMLGAKVIGRIDSLNAYRLQFDDQTATDSARTQLASNSEVASVENNYAIDLPETTQTVPGNTAPISLKLNPPPDNGRMVIGIVDTAYQSLGKDLDSFIQKRVSLAGDVQPDPATPTHGTMMVETMLSTLQQLGNGSTSVMINTYDIYGASETGNTFILAQGIARAVADGAKLINFSGGGPANRSIIADLVSQASQNGIPVIAAKGNNGPSTDPMFPAANAGATSVTAVNQNGQVFSWANQSSIPSVAALGAVTLPFNGASFFVEGTSPATAIVTATVAFLAEKNQISAAAANSQVLTRATPTTLPPK